MISFAMPAKNTSDFIEDAITSLQSENQVEWELIVVDDHSEDTTADIVKRLSGEDSRIRFFRNTGNGKIDALNFAYTQCRGEILKFIDSDDVIDSSIFSILSHHEIYDTVCHGTYITDEKLVTTGTYQLNMDFINGSFEECYADLRSIPRCMWSFKRQVADKIFPMPKVLPFEDVWFSLIIKFYEYSIFPSKDIPYYYRQHGNQVYGGVYNHSPEKVIFRAKRMLNLMSVLDNEQKHGFNAYKELTCCKKRFYYLMSLRSPSVLSIIRADISGKDKIKLILYKKINWFVQYSLRIKWIIDRYRRN